MENNEQETFDQLMRIIEEKKIRRTRTVDQLEYLIAVEKETVGTKETKENIKLVDKMKSLEIIILYYFDIFRRLLVQDKLSQARKLLKNLESAIEKVDECKGNIVHGLILRHKLSHLLLLKASSAWKEGLDSCTQLYPKLLIWIDDPRLLLINLECLIYFAYFALKVGNLSQMFQFVSLIKNKLELFMKNITNREKDNLVFEVLLFAKKEGFKDEDKYELYTLMMIGLTLYAIGLQKVQQNQKSKLILEKVSMLCLTLDSDAELLSITSVDMESLKSQSNFRITVNNLLVTPEKLPDNQEEEQYSEPKKIIISKKSKSLNKLKLIIPGSAINSDLVDMPINKPVTSIQESFLTYADRTASSGYHKKSKFQKNLLHKDHSGQDMMETGNVSWATFKPKGEVETRPKSRIRSESISEAESQELFHKKQSPQVLWNINEQIKEKSSTVVLIEAKEGHAKSSSNLHKGKNAIRMTKDLKSLLYKSELKEQMPDKYIFNNIQKVKPVSKMRNTVQLKGKVKTHNEPPIQQSSKIEFKLDKKLIMLNLMVDRPEPSNSTNATVTETKPRVSFINNTKVLNPKSKPVTPSIIQKQFLIKSSYELSNPKDIFYKKGCPSGYTELQFEERKNSFFNLNDSKPKMNGHKRAKSAMGQKNIPESIHSGLDGLRRGSMSEMEQGPVDNGSLKESVPQLFNEESNTLFMESQRKSLVQKSKLKREGSGLGDFGFSFNFGVETPKKGQKRVISGVEKIRRLMKSGAFKKWHRYNTFENENENINDKLGGDLQEPQSANRKLDNRRKGKNYLKQQTSKEFSEISDSNAKNDSNSILENEKQERNKTSKGSSSNLRGESVNPDRRSIEGGAKEEPEETGQNSKSKSRKTHLRKEANFQKGLEKLRSLELGYKQRQYCRIFGLRRLRPTTSLVMTVEGSPIVSKKREASCFGP